MFKKINLFDFETICRISASYEALPSRFSASISVQSAPSVRPSAFRLHTSLSSLTGTYAIATLAIPSISTHTLLHRFIRLITPVTPSNAPPMISTRFPSFPTIVSSSSHITMSSVFEATRIKFSICLPGTVIIVCASPAVWSIIYLSGSNSSFFAFSSLILS